jgi:hypothetical protein
MIDKNKIEVLNILVNGTHKEKSMILDEIWEERDVSMVTPLIDVLEREKSYKVKKRILTVLNRLVMLSGFRDIHMDIDFKRMLKSSDPFIRDGIAEILINSEMFFFDFHTLHPMKTH